MVQSQLIPCFLLFTNTQVETFDNYPETGTSYVDGSFEGQDGSTWSYVQTRGDQSLDGASSNARKRKNSRC